LSCQLYNDIQTCSLLSNLQKLVGLTNNFHETRRNLETNKIFIYWVQRIYSFIKRQKSKAVNKLLIQGWHQGPRYPRLRTPKNPNHNCVIKSDSTDGLKTFQAHNDIFAQPYSFKKKWKREAKMKLWLHSRSGAYNIQYPIILKRTLRKKYYSTGLANCMYILRFQNLKNKNHLREKNKNKKEKQKLSSPNWCFKFLWTN
jgi:hypothetical protein